MTIHLSSHFTYSRLLRFVLPSVVMMIFTSIYGVVDGLFVSNFVGKAPFTALNLIYPVLMIVGSLGFMIGTGGSALVSKTMGEGDGEGANRIFSMLVYVTVGLGVFFTLLGLIWIEPIAVLLGAGGEILADCVLYGRILLLSQTAFMLQNVFQSFLITAERPHLGLIITVAAGVTNIVLDAVMVAVLRWGLAGAAVASALSQVVGGVVPLFYFLHPKNDSPLRLTRAGFDGRVLWRTCTNGSSELMSNISMSLVNMLYNLQLIAVAGADGVAAYGVLMYINFVFNAIFIGYAIGSAPIVSFHYGAENWAEVKNLFRKSMVIVALSGVIMTVLAEVLSGPLSSLFVGYDAGLCAMTRRGFQIFSLSFLMTGFNIFGSAFFTALNDGVVSAVISFLRTMVFQVAAVWILPVFLKLDGVWLSVVAAEALALLVTAGFLAAKRKVYHYI